MTGGPASPVDRTAATLANPLSANSVFPGMRGDDFGDRNVAWYASRPSTHPYRPAMARITVEDCLHNVPNLFQLVLVASRRARKLANGAEATLDWENDKPTVLALREVAAGHVGLEILEEPDRPPQELMPEPEFMGELRAPQIGLGD